MQEEWEQEIRRNVAPRIIKAHLQGDLKTLKPWLGEAVYNKLAADIRIVSCPPLADVSYVKLNWRRGKRMGLCSTRRSSRSMRT